jgi:hypothetical protein
MFAVCRSACTICRIVDCWDMSPNQIFVVVDLLDIIGYELFVITTSLDPMQSHCAVTPTMTAFNRKSTQGFSYIHY